MNYNTKTYKMCMYHLENNDKAKYALTSQLRN